MLSLLDLVNGESCFQKAAIGIAIAIKQHICKQACLYHVTMDS
jgi:hypothetical protein